MKKARAARELRVKKARKALAAAGLDALLVTEPHDVAYLTGYSASGACFLIPRKGTPSLFVDGMNFTLAENMLEGRDIEIVPGDVLANAASRIGKKPRARTGVNEEAVSAARYRRLKRLAGKGVLKDASPLVSDLRAVKDADEIRVLRKAAKETVSIWKRISGKISTGMTEKDIAAMVDAEVLRRGFKNSFPTIAAIGGNTALPHAVPGPRRLKRGEHVLVDFGIVCQAYCSDLTRTWDAGRINGQISGFKRAVLEARSAALKSLKSGVTIAGLVEKAAGVLHKYNYGNYILHGLGHGVGLEVHERPYLRPRNREKLKAGMVVAVEPGLYKKGLGGVREEDMVLVTKTGCEVLTR